MLVVYHYPKCSTCRKALAWLDEHQVAHDRVDVVAQPPSAATLKKVLARSGLPIGKLFNTSGQSYRNGGFKARLATMSEREALAALADDGKLIKRPLVLGDDFALVGFRPDEYAERFA